MTKYIRVKEVYFGCISAQYIALLAACVALFTHLTFSIFFFINGILLGLIPLCITFITHASFFIIISHFRSSLGMTIFIIIEGLYAFVILGFAIWILTCIISPRSSFIYDYCMMHYPDTKCFAKTQLFSLIWGGLFVLFFFINVLIIPVFKNALRNIKIKRKNRRRSSVINIDDNQCSSSNQPIFNIHAPSPVNAHPQIHQVLIPPFNGTNGKCQIETNDGRITTITINVFNNENSISSDSDATDISKGCPNNCNTEINMEKL